MSCTTTGSTTGSNCTSRYKLKTPGPSYPQGLALLSPPALRAFYVASSNNKEDILVARIEFHEF